MIRTRRPTAGARRGGISTVQRRKLSDYIKTIGAYLYSDGTLNGSNIKNLGTGGSGLDGVPTAITIDANGMNFNGTTSIIAIASDATLQAWSGTFFCAAKPIDVGEGSSGTLYHWGNTINEFRFNAALTAFISREDTDNNDARDDTTTGMTAATLACLFRTYDDAGDRKIRIYKGGLGAVTEYGYSLQSAATGSMLAKSGAFNIGNRTLVDRTFNGSIKFYGWVNRILTAVEMETITRLSGA